MAAMNWSLRDLYRTLDEPGAISPRAAYAMCKDADILAVLLQLNQTHAAKEAAGESITPPGLPLPKEERSKFITADCTSKLVQRI